MGTVINNNRKHTHEHIQGSIWWCAKHHGATLNKLRSLVPKIKNWYKNKNELQDHTYLLLTYLLTPWSRVLLEKLTGLQLVKKLPTFYGTRRFITAFASALQRSLSQANSIQSIPPHPTPWRSITILSPNLCPGLPTTGTYIDLHCSPFKKGTY
jgi:hypothetical protein